MKKQKGFTIIELIVTIAIIAVLAAIVLVSVNQYTDKAKDATRKTELKEMQKAVELYYADHNSYPSTGGAWWGECSIFSSHIALIPNDPDGNSITYDASEYIPGIVPDYMGKLPVDPNGPDASSGADRCSSSDWDGMRCYLYNSDGDGYKIIAHCTPSSFSDADSFFDDQRPDYAYMVCSGNTADDCSQVSPSNPLSGCSCKW